MIFEPSADSRVMASSVWDVYQSYINVGFSEEQATVFIQSMLHGAMIANAISPPNPS